MQSIGNRLIKKGEKNTKKFEVLGLYRYSLLGSIRQIQIGIRNKKSARENYESPTPSGEPVSLYETQIWVGVLFLLMNLALTTWVVVALSVFYNSIPLWSRVTGLIFLLLGALGFLPIVGLIVAAGCIYAGKYNQ